MILLWINSKANFQKRDILLMINNLVISIQKVLCWEIWMDFPHNVFIIIIITKMNYISKINQSEKLNCNLLNNILAE